MGRRSCRGRNGGKGIEFEVEKEKGKLRAR